jgi:type IV fimbrial biogenesis protein FimT
MRHSRLTPRAAGFTLLELMVVVAIAAVLAAVAAPGMSTFIDNQRLRNGSFDLVSDLLLARSEAVTRNSVVVVSPSATGSDGWSGGWSINLGSATGAVLTSRTGVPPKLRFAATNASAAAVSSLSFGADGRLIGATPMRVAVTFTDPAPAGVSPSCIVIDATGRAKADKGAC